MITAAQLVAHALGDYVLQSDWMALEKTKRSSVALLHALCYSLPFLLFRPSLFAWLAIVVPHFVIDRWRLARHVGYVKNFLAPRSYWYPWAECDTTGYNKKRPDWMTVWLLIITDNILHVITNAVALTYL